MSKAYNIWHKGQKAWTRHRQNASEPERYTWIEAIEEYKYLTQCFTGDNHWQIRLMNADGTCVTQREQPNYIPQARVAGATTTEYEPVAWIFKDGKLLPIEYVFGNHVVLHEIPTNEYGVNDLHWLIYKYDYAGRYFHMPELAADRNQIETDKKYREATHTVSTTCHTNVRGLLPSTAPPQKIETHRVGTVVRIIRTGKVGTITRSRSKSVAETERGTYILEGLRPVGEHPSYNLRFEGEETDHHPLYWHCELELVK